MASWISFGAPCHTVWGGLTRGAECAYENRQDEIYNEYKAQDQRMWQRGMTERSVLFQQFTEIGKGLIAFVLIAAFLVYYLRD